MAATRNEAGWGHTRKKRAGELVGVLARAQEWLGGEDAGDRVAGVVLIVIEATKAGQPIAHKAAVVYGEAALRMVVEAADDALTSVASSIQAGEDARREARVRGRRGDA